jgi:hypothetical protein
MSDVLYELGAETWVRFGSNGIGFLNHKNSYNPKVSLRDDFGARELTFLQSCIGNWQEARTVAIMDGEAPGHMGFQGTSTVNASTAPLSRTLQIDNPQVKADFGPDSVDQSKSKHFTTSHDPEAEGQLNVAAWPRSKDSLFANGNENERYLVTSTDLMCV